MNIGARIKLARARARLSIRELAEKVGVSGTAISKFERGETMPRQSTLLNIAKALSVGAEFFFREVKVDVVCPAYRKRSSLSGRDRQAIEGIIVETLERYLSAEQLFPEGHDPGDFPRLTIDSVEGVEQAADSLRNEWTLGLDPVDDLCGSLEKCGVKVISVSGPSGFDGYSCWVNHKIPAIVFNSNSPGDRQRFDIAHELGHLALTGDSLDDEKAAHRFAAAFLVPASAVYAELGRKRSNLSFDELLLLKRKYRVSMQVWMRRAYDLAVIDQSTYTSLYKRLSARGWRSKEPDGVPKEEPQRLRLLVYQALAENLITPSYAATLLDEKPQHPVVEQALSEPSSALVKEYARNKELTAFADIDPEVLRDDDR